MTCWKILHDEFTFLKDGKTALKSPYDEKKCNSPIGNMYTDEGNKKKCQNGDAKHFWWTPKIKKYKQKLYLFITLMKDFHY